MLIFQYLILFIITYFFVFLNIFCLFVHNNNVNKEWRWHLCQKTKTNKTKTTIVTITKIARATRTIAAMKEITIMNVDS